ncbi:MAG: four helix bundle protein [Patescibacteria group bacterium]|jgi:hypothetical protein
MTQSDLISHNSSFKSPPPTGNLLVLGKTIAAYKLWHDWLKNFPKTSRFTLGIRLDQIFLELLEILATAQYLPKDKKLKPAIKSIKKIDLLKFYLRLCWEMKLFNDNKFRDLALKIEEIGRLAYAWKIGLEKTSPPTARTENKIDSGQPQSANCR